MIRRRKLCGHFVRSYLGDRAAQRLGAGQRESHIPEINVGGKELDADMGLTITLALNRNNPRFHFARAVFIDQQNNLADDKGMLGLNLRAVLAHRIRLHANGKLL